MLSNQEIDIVQKIYGSGAVFSFIGSSFIVLSYLLFKEFRTLTTFLIFFLGIADLGLSISNLMTWLYVYDLIPDHYKTICLIQAYGMQYFAISAFLWTSCIACHAYLTLKLKKRKSALKSYFKYYIAICFFIPTIPLIVGYFNDIYGPTEEELWCWIKKEYMPLRFGFYYGPLVFFWIFNVIIYILLSRSDTLSYEYLMKEGRKKLRLYLLVLILCKLPALTNRLANAFYSDPIYALIVFQAIFDSLFGFFDSLVYGIFKYKVKMLKNKIFGKDQSKRFEHTNTRVNETTPFIQASDPKPYSSIAERMYAKNNSYTNMGLSLVETKTIGLVS